MQKPLVGVLGHIESDSKFGINSKYIEFARKFGEPIIIDAASKAVLPIDILLLPGGRDVNPVRYGEAPEIYTQNSDPYYEWFYTSVFPLYLPKIKEGNLLVIGICAGFQNLNVVFGGKINQHIGQSYSTASRASLVDKLKMVGEAFPQNFEVPDHYITGNKTFTKPNGGDIVYGDKWYTVNSLHHQGVYDSKYSRSFSHTISDEMVTMAYNRSYGNVEIMRHRSLPIVAFQYHPEELINNNFEQSLINTMYSNMKQGVTEQLKVLN